jgi:ferric-dicitrate binding protein FerR (iron transport regulator)
MTGKADAARLLVLVLLGLVAAGGGAPARAQSAAVGTVTELVGVAVVTRHQAGAAEALAVGAELFEGDRIRTETGARLRLRLRDGSVLTCGETTDLQLDWVLYDEKEDARSVLLSVPLGIVRAVAELLRPSALYEMRTNTAVISVRGSDWIAEAQPDATAILALEGEIAVRNADPEVPGAVALGPGEGVTVEAGAPPPAPTVWGEPRRNSFLERTAVP